jgi:tetratricopeptide (TPR) repeat protein
MATDYKAPEHEQKGDIESFLDDLKRFWDRFGLTVLLAVLAVLIVILVTRYARGREERLREEAYAALSAAESPFAMEDVADRYGHVPGFAGYARLQAADLRVREAMGFIAGRDAAPTEIQRTAGLKGAAELYQQVIDANASPLQVLNARLGLAGVFESLGEFDKAAEQYQKVTEARDWPALAMRAERRLGGLKKLREPVTFPPPKPREEAAADTPEGAPIPEPAPPLAPQVPAAEPDPGAAPEPQ